MEWSKEKRVAIRYKYLSRGKASTTTIKICCNVMSSINSTNFVEPERIKPVWYRL